MLHYIAIFIGFLVGVCERILRHIKPEPLDFGKHNVLMRRKDGSLIAMTDDDLWGMLDTAAEFEDEREDRWLMLFAEAARKHGKGIYLNN